jgi:hypothetical protein
MSRRERDEEDADRRMTLNLLTIIAVLLLLLAGFWLMRELDRSKKAQDCLSSGSLRCRRIQANDLNLPRPIAAGLSRAVQAARGSAVPA